MLLLKLPKRDDFMENRKTIYDPIHGHITVDGIFLNLIDRHEIQRLRWVKQLGLSNIVFPGANHTRFEHSLGVYHLAGRMCQELNIDEDTTNSIRVAALFHDVCHPPFSHTLESIMEKKSGMNHMELSKALIFGKTPYYNEHFKEMFDGVEPISVLLENNGISADEVCNIIINPISKISGIETLTEEKQSFFKTKDYAHQIIHGPVDADQIDYLSRDAHYTGVSHGSIDTERLLTQMKIINNTIALSKGAIVAAEGLMVSRILMYSTIYYHKAVKIVEAMLRRAAELCEESLPSLHLMSDNDLLNFLLTSNKDSSEIVSQVLNRRLYKKALVVYSSDADEEFKSSLVKYSTPEKCSKLEEEIANLSKVDKSKIIVNIPSESSLLSKVKIGKTDVSIQDGDKVKSILKYSSIAKSLQTRDPIDWSIMVCCPEEFKETVGNAAKKILSFNNSDRS